MANFIRKILIVDDKFEDIKIIADFFSDKDWLVTLAKNGSDALTILEGMQWKCDCILLDLKMSVMDGTEFIEKINHVKPKVVIPIIVLSGKLEEYDVRNLYRYNVALVTSKGQSPEIIEALANNLCDKGHGKLSENFEKNIINLNSIDEATKTQEDLLEIYFKKVINQISENIYSDINEHLFVVARRWNSWYPSFFDVPGGCYSILSPICKDKNRNRTIVIDPGFRFLKVLHDINISVRDIETCLISHNHPDHMGGIFEYLACRYTAKLDSKLICSPNTFAMLSTLNNQKLEVRVLDNRQSLIECEKHKDKNCNIIINSFDTDHMEIGPRKDSKAIIFEFPDYDPYRKIVILGDTSFDLSHNRKKFLDELTDISTKVIVLHIGSSQLKTRVNGHLYLIGLHRLLTAIGEELEIKKRSKNDKLVVLISEWGLEHATKQQIEKICPDITDFKDSSIILDTIKILLQSLNDFQYNERMVIIPADIGLMVGAGSGMIYIRRNNQLELCEAENLVWNISDEGIEYSIK